MTEDEIYCLAMMLTDLDVPQCQVDQIIKLACEKAGVQYPPRTSK